MAHLETHSLPWRCILTHVSARVLSLLRLRATVFPCAVTRIVSSLDSRQGHDLEYGGLRGVRKSTCISIVLTLIMCAVTFPVQNMNIRDLPPILYVSQILVVFRQISNDAFVMVIELLNICYGNGASNAKNYCNCIGILNAAFASKFS